MKLILEELPLQGMIEVMNQQSLINSSNPIQTSHSTHIQIKIMDLNKEIKTLIIIPITMKIWGKCLYNTCKKMTRKWTKLSQWGMSSSIINNKGLCFINRRCTQFLIPQVNTSTPSKWLPTKGTTSIHPSKINITTCIKWPPT